MCNLETSHSLTRRELHNATLNQDRLIMIDTLGVAVPSTDVALDACARTIVAAPTFESTAGATVSAPSGFYVATESLRATNALRLIEFTPETKTVRQTTVNATLDARAGFDIDVDVDGTMCAVSYEDGGTETRRRRGVCVVDVSKKVGQTEDDGSSVVELRIGATTGGESGTKEFETVKLSRFNRGKIGGLVTMDEFKARFWKRRDDGGFEASTSAETRSDASRSETIGGMNTTQDGVGGGSWDPHDAEVFGCGVDADVVIFDARSAKRAAVVERAHARQTRDVQYNPNRPHELMTCGDDGLLKIWDARSHERPVKVIAGHSHWVWACAYNPVYDALLLSASSDGSVRLWCDDDAMPVDLLSGHTRKNSPSSSRVVRPIGARIARNSQSVHACAWSSSDPWTYASCSASGVVTFAEVPREEKYRILL